MNTIEIDTRRSAKLFKTDLNLRKAAIEATAKVIAKKQDELLLNIMTRDLSPGPFVSIAKPTLTKGGTNVAQQKADKSIKCKQCNGTGLAKNMLENCEACHGEGWINKIEYVECKSCDGKGFVNKRSKLFEPEHAYCEHGGDCDKCLNKCEPNPDVVDCEDYDDCDEYDDCDKCPNNVIQPACDTACKDCAHNVSMCGVCKGNGKFVKGSPAHHTSTIPFDYCKIGSNCKICDYRADDKTCPTCAECNHNKVKNKTRENGTQTTKKENTMKNKLNLDNIIEAGKVTLKQSKDVAICNQKGKMILATVRSSIINTPGIPASVKSLVQVEKYSDLVIGMVLNIAAQSFTNNETIQKAARAANFVGSYEVADSLLHLETVIESFISGALAPLNKVLKDVENMDEDELAANVQDSYDSKNR